MSKWQVGISISRIDYEIPNGRTVWGAFESAGPDAPSVWSGWFLTPGVSSFRRGGSVQGEARAVGKGPVGRWAQRGQ